MKNKLKISKILAWIALVIYVISLFLPYAELYRGNHSIAMSRDFVTFISFLFVLIIFMSLIIKDSFFSRLLLLIFSIALLWWCLLLSISTVYGARGITVGFYSLFFSTIILPIVAVIMISIPIHEKKIDGTELTDDLY